MLSPKNHMRGKCMRYNRDGCRGRGGTTKQKAGAKPAFR